MKIFNTLADLKAAKLAAGQVVETKGEISVGDGLGARYLIGTDVADEVDVFALANNNTATLLRDTQLDFRTGKGIFSTVQDMIDGIPLGGGTISVATLVYMAANSIRVKTLAYNTAIEQTWIIVPNATGTDDGGSYIDLDSGYQAKQVFNNDLLLEQFGAANSIDSTVYFQNAVNYHITSGIPLTTYLSNIVATNITVPTNWININISAKKLGNAYNGAEGCKITSAGSFLTIPLATSNHQTINLIGFTCVRSGSSRLDNAITIDIDGTRTFNYPINWNFDLSFRKWDNCFNFVRTGGSIDPDGFIGTMNHNNCNPYDCNAYIRLVGVYLNLCHINSCRMHGLAEVIRLTGGSGAFIDFINTHFEGVNTGGTDATRGIITIDALSLESRFSFHNHDWENCGQLFRVDSNQSRVFDATFTGKNRFNSYLVVDQEFKFINLANYSVDNMTIISNQSIIRTPSTVKLKTRSDTAYTSNRITLAYIPVSAYKADGVNYVSDPIAGVRQFGASAIGGYIDGSFEWIRPTNSATFYSANQALTKNHNITGDDIYVISTVIDLTSQSTKVGNPVAATINSNTIQYYPASFMGVSGLYYCVLLIKVGNGINITDFGSTVVAKAAKGISIGYGKYLEDIPTTVTDLLPRTGGNLRLTRSVATLGSAVIPLRSATNAPISSKATITDNEGGVYYEFANRGVANTGLKQRTTVVNSIDASKVVSVVDGDAPDVCKVTLTNNGANTCVFNITLTIN